MERVTQKQDQFFRSHPPSSRKKGFGFVGTYRELVTCGYLHIGRTLSDLLVVGFRERSGGRSQFELVMGGGMLSLGLAAGGPLQTLKRERGTEKRPVDNGITSQDSYLLLATK